MNRTPLVTVVTHTYNQEAYIARCLDGIVMQKTDFPIEAFIIDDASTDNTASIVREYAAKYPDIIHPVLLPENELMRTGLSGFWRHVRPIMKGKYLAVCDGDDYWTYPGKLQRMADYMEAHPQCNLTFHMTEDVCEVPGYRRYIPRLRRSRRVGVYELAIDPHAQMSAAMIRSSIYHEDREFVEDAFSGRYRWLDIRAYLACLRSGTAYGFSEKWSAYRINARGVYTSTKMKGEADALYRKQLQLIEECYDGHYRGLTARWEAKRHLDSILQRWTDNRRRGRYLPAVVHLLHGLIRHPRLFTRIYYHRYIR